MAPLGGNEGICTMGFHTMHDGGVTHACTFLYCSDIFATIYFFGWKMYIEALPVGVDNA